jgi:mannitol-1-phosphate 5-dehydrogenase
VRDRPALVGIGAGAIQLGLWAYYARRAGARVTIAEVDAARVAAIRRTGGAYWINVARFDRIEPVLVRPVEILNPTVSGDRARLVAALRTATDVVTAVPSTKDYAKVSSLLAEGLTGRKRPVAVYASENEIAAARRLERAVFPVGIPRGIGFADTVIERMGGPHLEPGFQRRVGIHPIAPGIRPALLVEDFDRIVVERAGIPRAPGYATIYGSFLAVGDIRLYEELKLYGHNAAHFLLGCLAWLKGYRLMSEFNGDSDFGLVGVDALRHETGGWFRKQYRKSGDAVATDEGFERWVVQLSRRIVNPYLYDAVERVIRDPMRKLAWDDRIIGTMRRAIGAGVPPRRYALGVAAALRLLHPRATREAALGELAGGWNETVPAGERRAVLVAVAEAWPLIAGWSPRRSPVLSSLPALRAYLHG